MRLQKLYLHLEALLFVKFNHFSLCQLGKNALKGISEQSFKSRGLRSVLRGEKNPAVDELCLWVSGSACTRGDSASMGRCQRAQSFRQCKRSRRFWERICWACNGICKVVCHLLLLKNVAWAVISLQKSINLCWRGRATAWCLLRERVHCKCCKCSFLGYNWIWSQLYSYIQPFSTPLLRVLKVSL